MRAQALEKSESHAVTLITMAKKYEIYVLKKCIYLSNGCSEIPLQWRGYSSPEDYRTSLTFLKKHSSILKPSNLGISLPLLFAIKEGASFFLIERSKKKQTSEPQRNMTSKGPSPFAPFPEPSQPPLARPYDF